MQVGCAMIESITGVLFGRQLSALECLYPELPSVRDFGGNGAETKVTGAQVGEAREGRQHDDGLHIRNVRVSFA